MNTSYSTKGFHLTEELEKYASNKVARLNRKVPYGLRSNADCLITFAQSVRKSTKYSTCNVLLTLQGKKFRAKETTQHMYAALDISMVQVEQQLRDYSRARRRGLLRRSAKKTKD